jgi:hypothetical protein
MSEEAPTEPLHNPAGRSHSPIVQAFLRDAEIPPALEARLAAANAAPRPELPAMPPALMVPWIDPAAVSPEIRYLAGVHALPNSISPTATAPLAVKSPQKHRARRAKRQAYDRDAYWLRLREADGLGCAAIRDTWNELLEPARKTIAPESWDKIDAKEKGRQIVKHGIAAAKKDQVIATTMTGDGDR